jgi:hypothetical protein
MIDASKSVFRIGEKKWEEQPRPLRVTFQSSFDARTFRSRYELAKANLGYTPTPRVRPCRTKDEEAVFKKKLMILKDLNNQAKTNNKDTSFSLRDNGSIWCFKKDANSGKWLRDPKWVETDGANVSHSTTKKPSTPQQGNRS